MANSKQAKKRAVQSEKRRQHNGSRRSMMRTLVKKVLTRPRKYPGVSTKLNRFFQRIFYSENVQTSLLAAS